MGLFKSAKKLFKKSIKFAKDSHSLEAISGALSGAASGIAAGASGGPYGMIAGGVIGAVAGGLAGTVQHQNTERQEAAQEKALQQQRDIANQQAAAAAVPIATDVAAQQTVDATNFDVNYATERKRAMSMADTSTSKRLQRWASNGKRKIL